MTQDRTRSGTHHVLTVQESQLVTDESQDNAEPWAELQELGKVGENPHSEPEEDTALLGSARLSLGRGALGTWSGGPAGDSSSGSGPGHLP